jgi:hypothetical protein
MLRWLLVLNLFFLFWNLTLHFKSISNTTELTSSPAPKKIPIKYVVDLLRKKDVSLVKKVLNSTAKRDSRSCHSVDPPSAHRKDQVGCAV